MYDIEFSIEALTITEVAYQMSDLLLECERPQTPLTEA